MDLEDKRCAFESNEREQLPWLTNTVLRDKLANLLIMFAACPFGSPTRTQSFDDRIRPALAKLRLESVGFSLDVEREHRGVYMVSLGLEFAASYYVEFCYL